MLYSVIFIKICRNITIKYIFNYIFRYIISIFNIKLYLHLFVFILGFIGANNYSLKRRFLFALDELIFSIYYDIKNINP